MELSVKQCDSILGAALFYVHMLSLGHIFNVMDYFIIVWIMTLQTISFPWPHNASSVIVWSLDCEFVAVE